VKTVQAAFLVALILAIGLAVRPTGAAGVSTGACVDLTIGPPQEVVSDARRDALGLAGWPDGTLHAATRRRHVRLLRDGRVRRIRAVSRFGRAFPRARDGTKTPGSGLSPAPGRT
jgi:hypothetical protein